MAAGLGNRAIAERLFLSPRTVEKQSEHAIDKLGVDSRAEIAAWHAREGQPASSWAVGCAAPEEGTAQRSSPWLLVEIAPCQTARLAADRWPIPKPESSSTREDGRV